MNKLVPANERPPKPSSPPTESDGTLSFTIWNQGGRVNWKELEEITSVPSGDRGKGPAANDDEDYDESDSSDDDKDDFD
jgi:hypothetical protein